MIILILSMIALDQWTKYLAISLQDGRIISVFHPFLSFMYVENRGAAFGIFQNQKWLLFSLSFIIIAYLFYFYYKHKNALKFMEKLSLNFIIAGALGNMIDRIGRGYVVDYISVVFPNGYHFPVFNLADICVVLGCIGLLCTLGLKKEEAKSGQIRE